MQVQDLKYVIGRKLVDQHIRQNAHLSEYDLFLSCWRVIEKNKDNFIVRAELSGHDPSAWRVLVYHDFSRYFLKTRRTFKLPVKTLAIPDKPIIVVTIHTGLELAIARSLGAQKTEASIIYLPSPQNREKYGLFSQLPNVSFIRADVNCLLKSREALARGRVLIAACDSPTAEDPRAKKSRAINGALFELAKRSHSKLLFVIPFVDDRGFIDFKSASPAAQSNQAHDYRVDFIQFLDRSGIGWIDWRLSGRNK